MHALARLEQAANLAGLSLLKVRVGGTVTEVTPSHYRVSGLSHFLKLGEWVSQQHGPLSQLGEVVRIDAAGATVKSFESKASAGLGDPVHRIGAFRLAPAGIPESELNALNQRFLDRVNVRQRVYLTATRLRGRFAPRICVLSFRTHRDRMEMALEDIAAARREVLGL